MLFHVNFNSITSQTRVGNVGGDVLATGWGYNPTTAIVRSWEDSKSFSVAFRMKY
jgi:hypothetical protein